MTRIYSKQFKENAIALSEEKGNTAEAARELGLYPSTLRRWKKEKRDYAHNSFPGGGKPKLAEEQKEIVALKKAPPLWS